MKTLYVRNVPEEVGLGLERLARREGMSVAAFALRELAEVARRADNPELLASLPDLAVPAASVVADLDEARRRR
ncbi:MAG TPA: antitoxin [Acidimicrobiia bacterium]|nr:antitoxin [Acidimicrobiia bacterium]